MLGDLFKNILFDDKKTIKTDFKLRLQPNQDYLLDINIRLPIKWYSILLEKLNKMQKTKVMLLDEFVVDKKFISEVEKQLWPIMRSIERQLRKQNPTASFLNVKIENMAVKKDVLANQVITKIIVKGLWNE